MKREEKIEKEERDIDIAEKNSKGRRRGSKKQGSMETWNSRQEKACRFIAWLPALGVSPTNSHCMS